MSIRLHQIYFRPEQLDGIDKAFIPYDNCDSDRPDLYEFYVFRREYLNGATKGTDYNGYVSWKFTEKTGLLGQQFINFCQNNPGHDVYFVNPYPMDIYSGNIWRHGEIHHPGLLELSQFIIDQVGYDIDLAAIPAELKTLSFCNYWVANEKFWDSYMAFCLPIYDYIMEKMPEPQRSQFFGIADRNRKASYFTFLFERLLTTYLYVNPAISFKSYVFTRKELVQNYKLNEVAIIERIQDIEKLKPSTLEAYKEDTLVMAALHYYSYYIAYSNPNVGKLILYALASKLWHALPFRKKLYANPNVHSLFHKVSEFLRENRTKNESDLKALK